MGGGVQRVVTFRGDEIYETRILGLKVVGWGLEAVRKW